MKGKNRFPTEQKQTHVTSISKGCCGIKLQRSQDVETIVTIKLTKADTRDDTCLRKEPEKNGARAVIAQATTEKNGIKLNEQA